MTEEEWLTDIPPRMMQHITEVSPASVRKLRLLGVAFARFLETQPDYADAKHVSHLGEDVAEGIRELSDPRAMCLGIPGDWRIAHLVLPRAEQLDQSVRKTIYYSGLQEGDQEPVDGPRWALARAYILCILGNPFRPVAFDPAWRTSDAVALARGIYDDRAFDRMPILADALQDAGCDNDDILNHCRDTATPHARGCWVVDLVLGKV